MLKGLIDFELFVLSYTSIIFAKGLSLSDELLLVQYVCRSGDVGMMIDNLSN